MELSSEIVARIARRDRSRSEATLQADIRALILAAGLNISDDDLDDQTQVVLESQVGDGTRHRIDIEVGLTVIEVKRSLSNANVRAEALAQLGRYVHRRVAQTDSRYLGILTDGREWHLYVPDPDSGTELIEAGKALIVTGAGDTAALIDWLRAVLATVDQVRPTADAIRHALGAESPAYAADHATLTALYASGAQMNEVKLKRRLWAKLLKTAFGSSFEDDEQLFINHTLLVITAEIIAHAVIGFDVSRTGPLGPEALVSGTSFRDAQIHGVVESDFFDWPLMIPGGVDFLRSLAHRLSRFDWSSAEVDHDVLKHLYESVISPDDRRSLGEYYTPDWLAEQIVQEVVTEPGSQTVLDPSCGSGTFVFHAVRSHVSAQEISGVSPGAAAESAVHHIYGMDVHPVAVTLARVTYLLALGTVRLNDPDRGEITIPVFLGDSVQWDQRRDLFDEHGTVTIHTDDHELVEGGGGTMFEDDLVFPIDIIHDADRFDTIVREMGEAAMDATNSYDKTLIAPIMRRAGVTDAEQKAVITTTFSVMRGLHRTGNDHIWSYYVRNLVRPLWLASGSRQVDVVIGNPPWLRYASMTSAMQDRYLALCRERNLLSGPLGASGRDLSTLFVARCVELYLRDGGRFGFVMPHGTMTRKPHDGFRSGKWVHASVAFTQPWDLGPSSAATGFPVPSCVVFGSKSDSAFRLSPDVDRWTVRVGRRGGASGAPVIEREPGEVYVLSPDDPEPESPYRKKFRQGAILVPRVLFLVDETTVGPLGAGAGRVMLKSRPSEKPPWRDVEPLSSAVEATFMHPVHVGQTVLPFRTLTTAHAVVPIDPQDTKELLSLDEVRNYPALAAWWDRVESEWRAHRKPSEKADLIDRVDYSGQLRAQLPPGQHPHRVVYSKAGNAIAAARLEGDASLIDHKLYWAPVQSADEGRYLVGILSSAAMHASVAPMQSLGLFGTRDFDKLVFRVPFPAFDEQNDAHREVATIAGRAEQLAASVDISDAPTFKHARTRIREALAGSGVSSELEEAVAKILPVVSL